MADGLEWSGAPWYGQLGGQTEPRRWVPQMVGGERGATWSGHLGEQTEPRRELQMVGGEERRG